MKKKMRTFGLIVLLLCNMMGTSTFLSSRNILKNAFSCKISLLLWVLSAVISVFFGLCYAELGSTYPEAGGDVVYLSNAFSPYVGLAYSLCSLFMILPACASLFCRMIHGEIGSLSPSLMTTTVIILVVCSLIVLMGNDLLVFVCKIAFYIKILTVLSFLLLSLYTIFIKKIEHVAAFYDPRGSVSQRSNIRGLTAAMLFGMWGFDGWNCGNYIANEIYDPASTLKIGITLSIILACSFIVIINIAFLLVVPYDLYIDDTQSFIVEYFNLLGIKISGTAISTFTVTIPLFGTILGLIIVYKGIAHNLIKNRVKRGDLYGLVLMILLTLIYSKANREEVLLKSMQISTVLFYTLCCYGLLILRYKKPDTFRPYKCHTSIPIIAAIAGTMLIIAFYTVKVN
ncbi:Cystine/glutamate transporter [Nosema granulosis]|uniref:Cystine/glutamate transporter n=1 Tax=Nosema granulosis TaxID=83296 RepID=A0A9P6H007_9MICR|nr:Cystine/glutamate transporter [Nosema granulosis]